MSGVTAPVLENLLKISNQLINIISGTSHATTPLDGVGSGVTPDHSPDVSRDDPSTMMLPRQVRVARASNAVPSNAQIAGRSLNVSFTPQESFSQDYSPRASRRAPAREECRRSPARAVSLPRSTSVRALDKRINTCTTRPAGPECETPHPELHPTDSCGELDSAASFRDNVEEVNSFREIQFKDGVKVAVPSDINLDSSRVLEFIYNTAPKPAGPSREDSEVNKNLLSARSTQGSRDSCVLPKIC